MKNYFKRATVILLSLILCFSHVTVTALAADVRSEDEAIAEEQLIENGEAAVTGEIAEADPEVTEETPEEAAAEAEEPVDVQDSEVIATNADEVEEDPYYMYYYNGKVRGLDKDKYIQEGESLGLDFTLFTNVDLEREDGSGYFYIWAQDNCDGQTYRLEDGIKVTKDDSEEGKYNVSFEYTPSGRGAHKLQFMFLLGEIQGADDTEMFSVNFTVKNDFLKWFFAHVTEITSMNGESLFACLGKEELLTQKLYESGLEEGFYGLSEIKTVTVRFDGSSEPVYEYSVITPDEDGFFVLPEGPDMRFAGWNTQSGGRGEEFGSGDRIRGLVKCDAPEDATMVLYEQWNMRVSDYTVTFDANGGKGAVPAKMTASSMTPDVTMGNIGAEVPTRSGYVFFGWSADPEWSTDRIAFSRTGGGLTAPDGTSAVITGKSWSYEDYCLSTGGNSSDPTLKLYAQWKKINDYTITFDINGGKGAVPVRITKTSMSPAVTMGNINASVPTRKGYTFCGWSADPEWGTDRIAYSRTLGGLTAPDGTAAVVTGKSWSYEDYCRSTGGDSSDPTLKLYAQWKKINDYTITFDLNGGKGAAPVKITRSSMTPDVTMGNISAVVPARSGYTFCGWSADKEWSADRIAFNSTCGGMTAPDGTAAVKTGTSWSYKDYCRSTGGDSSDMTLKLYAQWQKTNSYTITFDINGGKGAVPAKITRSSMTPDVKMGNISAAVPTRSGYTFCGWSSDREWSTDRIAFSSTSGGATAPDGTAAVKTGTSWSYDEYCLRTGRDSSDTTLKLYAQWQKTNSYTIIFDINGGKGAVPAKITRSSMTPDVKMGNISATVPTRSGYVFCGWSATPKWSTDRIAFSSACGGRTAPDGTSAVKTGTSWSYNDYCRSTGRDSSDPTLKLYAQWIKK